ncbi:hypothetical protein ACVK1X_004595 [Pseudomonas sp. PvR086]|nr:hypothetical protein [Pseudomonas frederiksbergensis]
MKWIVYRIGYRVGTQALQDEGGSTADSVVSTSA